MRKILFSLVEAAARLLAPSPNGMEIFNTVRNHLKNKSQPTPDSRSVRQLVDMGFPQQKVIKALTLKRYSHQKSTFNQCLIIKPFIIEYFDARLNTAEALEWLLQHQDETEEADAHRQAEGVFIR